MGTLLIEPSSRWDNGYVESFNGKLRDELLDKEIISPFNSASLSLPLKLREEARGAGATPQGSGEKPVRCEVAHSKHTRTSSCSCPDTIFAAPCLRAGRPRRNSTRISTHCDAKTACFCAGL